MIPALLPTLVRAVGDVKLDVESQATQRLVLNALEALRMRGESVPQTHWFHRCACNRIETHWSGRVGKSIRGSRR
jgi:hypothetical protein